MVRARVGFLVTPSFLAYATGGVAFGRTDIALAGGDRTRDWQTGYQVGLGTELKLNANWALRLEYLYTDLGDKTFTHSGLTNKFDTDFHTLRAGVTFKF